MKYERQIYWGVIIWLFFGDTAAEALLKVPFIAKVPILNAVVRILSLSDLLSGATTAIANGMLKFWHLIPIFG